MGRGGQRLCPHVQPGWPRCDRDPDRGADREQQDPEAPSPTDPRPAPASQTLGGPRRLQLSRMWSATSKLFSLNKQGLLLPPRWHSVPDTEEDCRQAGVAGWAQGHLGPCPSSAPLAVTLSQPLGPSVPQFPHQRQDRRGRHLVRTPGTDPQPPWCLSLSIPAKQEPGTPCSECGRRAVGRDILTSPSSSGDPPAERTPGPLPRGATVPHLRARLSDKVPGNPHQL